MMYAANRNRLSEKTVHVLKIITVDTGKPFVIPGIVDRMAAMLNYVLSHRHISYLYIEDKPD